MVQPSLLPGGISEVQLLPHSQIRSLSFNKGFPPLTIVFLQLVCKLIWNKNLREMSIIFWKERAYI